MAAEATFEGLVVVDEGAGGELRFMVYLVVIRDLGSD